MIYIEHEYGRDFSALRSVLGLEKEELSKMVLLKVETIDKIENSIDFTDIDSDSLFKIYYLSKLIEEDKNIYMQNKTINKLAGMIANRSSVVLKSKVKDIIGVRKPIDGISKAKKITVHDVLPNKVEESISETDFMELLLSAMIVRNYQPPIVDLYELDSDLAEFKMRSLEENSGYKKLLGNIKSIDENNVDLRSAVAKATSNNSLIKVPTENDSKIYLINIDEDQAKKNLKKYNQDDVLNMLILVDRLKEKGAEHERERGPILQKLVSIKKYVA